MKPPFKSRNLLSSIGLLWAASACVAPPNLPTGSQGDVSGSSDTSSAVSSAASCETTVSTPEPLSTPENSPAFEQFNFRPQEIAIANNTVTITTPHHIFSLCQTNGTWSIASAEASEDEEPFDYDKLLANMAEPDYDTVELNGETYEYRIRLQAQWLAEQLKPPTTDPEDVTLPGEVSAEEDAVFFELKKPDGEVIIESLYTLSELQAARLGASLGAPEIAGVATTDTAVWFAASSSQGEGDSGFASLIKYDLAAGELSVEQPEEIQGAQLTSLVTTGSSDTEENPLTLWFGTLRSGEGNPYIPADGLVAYQPATQSIETYTVTTSPLVGAIPHELALSKDALWVGTGEGVCEVDWQAIAAADSWNCWRFTATAQLPAEGVDIYSSFLAAEPAGQLKKDSVEVLWASQSFDEVAAANATNVDSEPAAMRYEVVYEPGFETQLSQGGYRITNEAALRASGGNDIFWPGNQWHWAGDRFTRSLDEVALNLVGGGPRGLVGSNSRNGFDLDNKAVRGEFDLLELTSESTKVRYYSGWINGDAVTVYPAVVPTNPADAKDDEQPNPLTEMASDLTESQGP